MRVATLQRSPHRRTCNAAPACASRCERRAGQSKVGKWHELGPARPKREWAGAETGRGGHRLPAAPAPPPTSRASGAQTRRAAPGPGIGHFAFERERERERASARRSPAASTALWMHCYAWDHIGENGRDRSFPQRLRTVAQADARSADHRRHERVTTLYTSSAERGAQCRTSSLTRMFAPFAAITAFSSMYLPRWGCPQ